MRVEHTQPDTIPANDHHGEIVPRPYYTIVFDLVEIENWLCNEATEDQRQNVGYYPDEFADDPGGYVHHLFSNASSSVMEQLDTFGLRWINDELTFTTHAPLKAEHGKLYWVKHQFEGIYAVTNLVAIAYEHTAPDRDSWGTMLADLGGDDDVDYNGSYIDCGADVLMMYLEAHTDALPECQ